MIRFASSGPNASSAQSSCGFTLIELMVTIALMAIVLGLASPSFVTFQRNSDLTTTANAFVGAVSTARAEAMKRQLDAYIVPCNTPTSCSFADNWANGWRVFINTVAAAPDPNASTNIIISQHEPAPPNVVPSGLLNGSQQYVGFSGAGFMKQTSGAFGIPGKLQVKHLLTGEIRNVILNPSGRVRVCKPAGTVDPSCDVSDTFS